MTAHAKPLCKTCLWKPSFAKQECNTCYTYRNHYGKRRPEEAIVAHARRVSGQTAPRSRREPELSSSILEAEDTIETTITLGQWRAQQAATKPEPTCTMSDCSTAEYAHGLCKRHADLAYLRA